MAPMQIRAERLSLSLTRRSGAGLRGKIVTGVSLRLALEKLALENWIRGQLK
ncbi:hypothetical protein JQ629_16640 [Bradyrhizobium sp. AUGA SZCCT0222]|nr:hypothetical protein [Bradyrhizobium sp. AUGA SZCCT0222]